MLMFFSDLQLANAVLSRLNILLGMKKLERRSHSANALGPIAER